MLKVHEFFDRFYRIVECVGALCNCVDIEAGTSQKQLSHHFFNTLLCPFLVYQGVE
jgi:hypothetical protein